MAVGLLRHHLERAGSVADVESAGLLPGGQSATDHAVAVLAGRGLDMASHVSRQLAEADPGGFDLVIGMERRHVQEALIVAPEAQSRAFTLIDLVHRSEAEPPRRPEETIREWAGRLAAGRTHAELIGKGDDGVADPVGGSRDQYEGTADLLDDLLGRLVARAFAADQQEVGT